MAIRHKHRKRQVIVNYTLSFILALSLIVLVITSLFKYTCLSERAVENALDNAHYSYYLKNEIETTAMNYAVPFGIDKNCLKKILTEKEVKEDILKVFHQKLKGGNIIIDVGGLEKRIERNVIKKEGSLSDDQKASLKVYIKKVSDMYQKKIHIPTEDIMANLINWSTKVAWVAIPASIMLIVLCATYLIASRHYAYHGIRYVTYGIMGAGIFLTVVMSAIIANDTIYRYNISDAYMKRFYVYWIGHPLLTIVIYGVGCLVLGFVGIFLVYRQKYRVRQ